MIGWSIKSCSGLCSRKASGCATGSAHQKLKKSIMDEWKTSKQDGLTLLFPKPLGALYTRGHNSVCTGSSLCHFGWLGSVVASPLHPCGGNGPEWPKGRSYFGISHAFSSLGPVPSRGHLKCWIQSTTSAACTRPGNGVVGGVSQLESPPQIEWEFHFSFQHQNLQNHQPAELTTAERLQPSAAAVVAGKRSPSSWFFARGMCSASNWFLSFWALDLPWSTEMMPW